MLLFAYVPLDMNLQAVLGYHSGVEVLRHEARCMESVSDAQSNVSIW